MKTRVAAVLSLSGVLVAGSAAALVNSEVLSSQASGGAESTFRTSDSSSTTQPDSSSTSVPNSSLPDSSVPEHTESNIATAVATGTQATYQMGPAGSVTLAVSDDAIGIVSISPSAGWTVKEAENEGPTKVEIELVSATSEVEFSADLVFGVVTTSVETDSLDQPDGSTPSTIDDDDQGDVNDDHGDDHDDDGDNSGSGSSHDDDDEDSDNSGSGSSHDDDDDGDDNSGHGGGDDD